MATSSSSSVLNPSARSTSPQFKGLKKVLSTRRRSSEVTSDGGRSSVDSATLEKTGNLGSTRSSPTRDDGTAAGSGMRKLIPGHGKRQRKKKREEEIRAAMEGEMRGRSLEPSVVPAPIPTSANQSNSSLLTDADFDTPPPLVSRNSHTGYFTTSSPLISSKTVGETHTRAESDGAIIGASTTGSIPSILAPEPYSREPSPRSGLKLASTSSVLASDRTNMLQVDGDDSRRTSFGRLRGVSPARKMRDIFTKSSRSPRTSPERSSATSIHKTVSSSRDRSPLDVTRGSVDSSMDGSVSSDHQISRGATGLAPIRIPAPAEADVNTPQTPPSAALSMPSTTVTPPTPVETQRGQFARADGTAEQSRDTSSPTSTVPSAVLSHRRVRSASSATHSKSKLSTSSIPPLTPTIEELSSPTDNATGSARSATPSSGFFSSWVSAAQTAASSLSNLTGQNNRNRSSTTVSDPIKSKGVSSAQADVVSSPQNDAARKKLAVETLGSGDLNFGHLGLDASMSDDQTPTSARPQLSDLRQNSDFNRNEAQAKVEDVLAKRAVSAAYEKSSDVTPVAEISDPIAHLKQSQTFELNSNTGTLTPPNGSIFEGETGPFKRSNSVRSKIANRRSRGSSIATGQSAIGNSGGASTTTLVSPSGATKVSGFTPAPKARNRVFHQLFRSVPEDDNLIEDYSCALQKEILLAGRIYISEGHICFSSNILGWVTTLIISFEEIVSIEREYTAMIIPNAIAIQTLHARHTIRSLLSREATFDLIIGIWKVNHPASFQKSVNGKQLVAEQTQHVVADAIGPGEAVSHGSDDDDNESDSDDAHGEDDDADDGDSLRSVTGSGMSVAGSEFLDAKSTARKPSGVTGAPTAGGVGGDAGSAMGTTGGVGAAVDFPGPVTHAPTDCSDSGTHYEKIIKDEVISAPLGKVYSLLYGPQSGVFVRKYLVDECKCTDLVFEDDKKGLNDEIKERQYSYIKPLNAPIGPKSTKCITTEALNVFDLEKSISVTCTTQTPDVPSGNAFSTKTRYCLSWAPGNATRLQMNCTIEWTGKSWLKTAIERGANDGQQQYGDGLVKALKAALGRARAATAGSKGAKTKKRRKGERKAKGEKLDETPAIQNDWGLFEPVRPILGPISDVAGPIFRTELVVVVLTIMVLILWFGRSSKKGDMMDPGLRTAERLAAYDELWAREENDLWEWLEARAGVDRVMLTGREGLQKDKDRTNKQKEQERRKHLRSKDFAVRLRAEKWSQREMQEAVKVTRQRLDEMQDVLNNQAS